jgi:hypothetical protein
MMRMNIGRMDRALRIVGAVALAGVCATGLVSRAWCPALLGASVVLLLTASFRFCGLYGACNVDTLEKGDRK